MGLITSLLVAGLLLLNASDKHKGENTAAKNDAALKVTILQPVLAKNKTAVKVVVQNNPDKLVEIRIRDAHGNLIFNDFVKHQENFSKSYVLSQLIPGTYFIEVLNKNAFTSEELIIH